MAWVSVSSRSGSQSVSGSPTFSRSAGYGEADSAHWRVADGVTTVQSDMLGIVPLYYGVAGGMFACADRISDLFNIGIDDAVDPLVRALNRHLSFCPAELTVFKSIRRVPPGSVLTWSNGKVDLRSCYEPPKPADHARADAAKIYGELFEASVARLAAPFQNVAIPLSGGRDSRHILFAAKALGKNVETLTFDNYPPSNVDLDTAAQLSRRLEYRHWPLENTEYDHHASIVRTLLEIEFETQQHGWMWSLIPKLKEIGRPFIDGLGGDTLSNGLFFSSQTNRMMRERRYADVTNAMINDMASSRSMSQALRPGGERDRLSGILLAEVSRWEAWPNPQMAFTFFGRTRRAIGIAPMVMSRLSNVPPLLPYLDKSVFEFLMGLNEAFFERKGFHDEAIAARYPQYADIPYGTSRGSGRLGYRRSSRNALAYLRKSTAAHFEGGQEMVGVLKVLLGADFAKESYRFTGVDFDCALAAARRAVNRDEPADTPRTAR